MPTYLDLLNDIGDKIVYDAKSILKQKKKIASGTLYESLKYKIEGNKLLFEMASYGRWVDEGRKPGKYVPVKALESWMKLKGIDLKYSFVINRSIKEKGIKPTYFFSTAFENNMDDFDDAIDMYVSSMLDTLEF